MDRDSRGSMPFAVIAVTLLMMSVVCGAVMAGYDRASENTESIGKDSEAVDRAAAGIARHIDRGLGDIILQVSRDPSLGGLEDRMEEFDSRMADWFAFQFPVVDSGVRAEDPRFDIELRAESMRNLDGDPPNGGHVPSYLKGVGTVKVHMRTASGTCDRVLDISTDGSYALPLAAEQGSMFEDMAGGSGFSISQMIEYQLACLAQSRVINGYGSDNAGAGMGTGDIITPSDVEDAYGNALSAASLICFRNTAEGLQWYGGVDLADVLLEEDGCLSVDLDAFFAQALFCCIDRMALKWFEYFSGDRVADALFGHLRTLVEVGRSIKDLLLGKSVFGAESYIRESMKRAGYAESDWRHPGSGMTVGSVNGVEFSVSNPTTDILDENWVKRFKLDRQLQGNYVLDAMKDILRSAAVKAGERSGYDTVEVRLDPADGKSFAETLSEVYAERSQSLWSMFQELVWGEAGDRELADPFCVEVADRISSESHRFLRTSEFERDLRGQVASAFPEYCDDVCDVPDCGNPLCDDPGHRLRLETLLESYGYRSMVYEYERGVINDLRQFEALREQPGRTNIIQELVSGIVSVGMQVLGIISPVEETMDGMMREMGMIIATNPHSGITETPDGDRFRLQDGEGNSRGEVLRVECMESDPAAVVSLEPSRCVHNIGFGADMLTAYTTVFSVYVTDSVRYSVNGSGALADSMGLVTTAVQGSFANSVRIEIPVVSGWALDGVEYQKSTTFAGDVLEKAEKLLAPVLEPLRKALEAFRNAVTLALEKLVEVGRYAADVLADVYERIMQPVYELQRWMQENIDRVFGEAGVRIYNCIARDLQYSSISFCGYVLTLETDAASWLDSTKSLLRVSVGGIVSGLDFTAGLEFKCRGEVRSENIGISAFGELEGEDWRIKGSVDPLMKFSKHILSVTGWTPSNKISVVVPEMVEYHDVSMSLKDLSATGNPPSVVVPFLGMKASVDAGFQIRYSDPERKGLIVNEFESNPEGNNDRGREWVELLNNSPVALDLTGYTLSASSDWKTKRMDLTGTIGPGEYLVVVPEFVLVNEKGKFTKNGESLTVRDPNGDVVDKTPTLKDSRNDGATWHRLKDGATEWVFGTPTKGTANEGRMNGFLTKERAADIALRSLDAAFDEVPRIDSTETCQSFVLALVKNCLDIIIDEVTGSVIDASVFAEVRAGDVTGTADAGVRIALRADQRLASDVLKYMAGKLQEIVLHAENPYSMDPLGMFTENISMETTFDAGIGAPDLFGVRISETGDVRVGVTFRTNVAALTHVFGRDTGRPELVFGVVMPDLRELALVPSRLDPDPDMSRDLWLIKATVRWK